MSKLMLVAAGAVGYVFGARAGKKRYAEIKSKVTEMWQNPKVQEERDRAKELVKDKARSVQERVTSAASKAAAKGKRAASRRGRNDAGTEMDTLAMADVPVDEVGGAAEPTPMADGIGAATENTHG